MVNHSSTMPSRADIMQARMDALERAADTLNYAYLAAVKPDTFARLMPAIQEVSGSEWHRVSVMYSTIACCLRDTLHREEHPEYRTASECALDMRRALHEYRATMPASVVRMLSEVLTMLGSASRPLTLAPTHEAPKRGMWPGVIAVTGDANMLCLDCASEVYGAVAIECLVDGRPYGDTYDGVPRDSEGNHLHAVLWGSEDCVDVDSPTDAYGCHPARQCECGALFDY